MGFMSSLVRLPISWGKRGIVYVFSKIYHDENFELDLSSLDFFVPNQLFFALKWSKDSSLMNFYYKSCNEITFQGFISQHLSILIPYAPCVEWLTYIYHEFKPNVGKYTIHASYGHCSVCCQLHGSASWDWCTVVLLMVQKSCQPADVQVVVSKTFTPTWGYDPI